MSWAAEEFATVDLGDKRLNKRLVKVAQQWADKPSQSIPNASGGWGDTAAAYRMLDNERCDWREILGAHGQCTTLTKRLFSRLSPRSTVANSSAAQLIANFRHQIIDLQMVAHVVCNDMHLATCFDDGN